MSIFVGRDDEVARCERAGFILLSGEPGIGKSRLADEVARRAADEGVVVAWGRAWEGEGTPAYWPWLEVFRALSDDPRTASAMARCLDQSRELRGLLANQPLGAEDRQARFQLLDRVTTALRSVASEAALLLVLDDLHAADTASLELLAFLARGLKTSRIRIVGTARDGAFVRDDVAGVLAKASREAITVPLRRLSRDEVKSWIERAAPSLSARSDQLFENSDGNPLFASELIAAWQSGGAISKTFGIDDAIRAHVALLSPAARRALSRASVLGRHHTHGALRALDVDDAAIDDALASGLLVADSGGRLRFNHVLIRDELYRELPAQQRRELHHAAAQHFAGEPEQAVSHLLAAADLSAPDLVLAAVLAAMRAATGRLAFSDAAALGMRALTAADASWSPIQRAELQVEIGAALIVAGDPDAGRALCVKAAEVAEADGNAMLLARVALVHASEHRIGRHEASLALLRRAIAAEPPDRVRVQVLAKLATASIPATPEEGDLPLRLAREALATARELGDPEALLVTLCAMLATFPHEFTLGERLSLSAEAVALARRLGQLARALPILGWTVASWLELGQLEAARNEMRASQELIATLPPHHAWRGELFGAMFAALEGRFDESAVTARRVLASGNPEAAHQAAIQLMILPYLHGDRAAYAEDDARVFQSMAPIPGSEIFLGIGDATCGRVDRVRNAIAKARLLDLSALPGAAQLGAPVVATGLTEHAEVFYPLAAAAAVRSPLLFGPNALGTFGPVDLLAAQLAHMMGRTELAHEHLARARAYTEQLGAAGFIRQVAHVARTIEHAGPPVKAPPGPTRALVLERRGELWAVGAGGRELLLDHRRGFDYLAALVAAPHREIHVLELAGIEEDSDAGPVLDAKAKRAYRDRAEALREQLAEAERHGDLGRAEAARSELESLANELARALGLGGRDRRAGASAERARINVQRRLADVVRRIGEQDAILGHHLELSLKTGTFCRYAPTWEHSFQGTERP